MEIIKTKENKIINTILIVFIILLFISELISKRFELNDFKVYYYAMKNFFDNKPIYGIPFGLGSGFYKYAPIALFPFAIFYFIPYFFASIIYYFLIGISIIVFFNYFSLLSKKIFNSNSSNAIFITLIVSFVHLHRELHLGNVNMLLLLLYTFAFYFIYNEKSVLSGILIGIGLLFKLHFIVLIPILFIFKKIKLAFVSIFTFLTSLSLIFIFKGFENGLNLYNDWFNIMKVHNANIFYHPDTAYFYFVKLLKFINPSIPEIIAMLVVISVIFILFVYFVIKNGKILSEKPDLEVFFLTYFFAIAMIPSLTLTDTEHFLFSLPVIYIGASLIYNNASMGYKLLFTVGLLLYGGNWHDLWGHKISIFLASNGFLGVGNIILVSVSYFFVVKNFEKIKNNTLFVK